MILDYYILQYLSTGIVRYTNDQDLMLKLTREEGWTLIACSCGKPKEASTF